MALVWANLADTNSSAVSELERIAALREQGVLTDEEFASQKARILGTPTAPVTPNPSRGEIASDGIGDLWVYAILALPLLAAVLLVIAPGGGAAPSIGKFFTLPNLVLMLLDHGRLKAIGKPLPVWQLVLGFLFIPIYLFFRARALRRGYVYVLLYFVAIIVALFASFIAAESYGERIDSR